MQVGIGLPNTLEPVDDSMVTWAERADEGPFTSLGVFDRLQYHSTDPLSTLAVCAGATDEVRLATTVVAGPIRNTPMLAKRTATLDLLSNGRLTLGIALGAREDDYAAASCGNDDCRLSSYEDRGRRFNRQLAELRDHWEGDDIGPDPATDGGPELLVGGDSDPTFQRAARYADGYVHGGGPPKAFGRQADRARAAWSEAGRPGRPTLWGHGYYALGDEAANRGREYLLDYYEFTGPFAERIADGLLTTPQEVLQFVRGYEDRGCDELILFPTVADIEQIDRLADVLDGGR